MKTLLVLFIVILLTSCEVKRVPNTKIVVLKKSGKYLKVKNLSNNTTCIWENRLPYEVGDTIAIHTIELK